MKAVLSLLFLFCVAFPRAQVARLTHGPHKVGFLNTVLFDASRPAVEEQTSKSKGRILQLNVWYPAHSVQGSQTVFADYVHLVGRELTDSVSNSVWRQKGIDTYFGWPASLGANKAAFMGFLAKRLPMRAYNQARFSAGDHPIIMLVHGFAADYAYMAEYLASHGAVVLHIPTKGTHRSELDYEGGGLETQVLDYEFGLAFLKKKFSLRAQKTAVVGFSFGGQSALALAIRNPHVKAVVSLDGGIGSEFGGALLSRQSFYDSNRITAPILHLYNPADPHTNLSWLNRYSLVPRCYVAFKNMEHGYFTSFGFLRKFYLPDIMGKTAPNPGDAYEAMMLLSKEFITIHLKQGFGKWEAHLVQLRKQFPWINEPIAHVQQARPAAPSGKT